MRSGVELRLLPELSLLWTVELLPLRLELGTVKLLLLRPLELLRAIPLLRLWAIELLRALKLLHLRAVKLLPLCLQLRVLRLLRPGHLELRPLVHLPLGKSALLHRPLRLQVV